MSTPLHTPDDLAQVLQVSAQQVKRRAASGEFPHVRLGRAFRFTDEHVQQIIASHEVAVVVEPEAPWGRVTRRRAS